ncbi:hypothetical protein B0T26DRAFT_687646 [Lasiosphaeria miniovina]|uniref:Uncharacterized protein n=1 Tax=Lasiosphaeria miniovina TaxID=1954250 RepID=A0AA40BHC4_9PEZI|nr:uncharacterized protein B0T26DRAFT_687646 [Lasiosphaeria miniovina]KAK0734204.1 hypothetical protein B0T26DRAFT_687646 [Lasiosphaeria miniovina]
MFVVMYVGVGVDGIVALGVLVVVVVVVVGDVGDRGPTVAHGVAPMQARARPRKGVVDAIADVAELGGGGEREDVEAYPLPGQHRGCSGWRGVHDACSVIMVGGRRRDLTDAAKLRPY